jgi:hypothetical protein
VVYLTLDTGNMRDAEGIAQILRKHEVKATFFLANERTPRGDHALDPAWAGYWKARAAEGHAFGTHTWRHGRILGDAQRRGPLPAAVRRRGWAHHTPDAPRSGAKNCSGSTVAFESMTGQHWIRCGARRAVTRQPQCAGRGAVLWLRPRGLGPAGFLGDELPSDKYPNDHLLARALRDMRDGDILMAHLGIWSRVDPFAPMLDPLIGGLRKRGLCLRTLREHPQFAVPPNVVRQMPATRSAANPAS